VDGQRKTKFKLYGKLAAIIAHHNELIESDKIDRGKDRMKEIKGGERAMMML
jgi:hypothetical protein